MKIDTVRRYALSLPEVIEAPHFDYGSFRLRGGRMIATVPPGGELLHVFLPDALREPLLAMHPEFLEKLLWGGKVVGLRVRLPEATPAVVKRMLLQTWEAKAPKKLVTQAKVAGAK